MQREQNYKQQKAQLQKQKEDAFDAFARQVKEGHVPDEWVKLYDGYVEKIKEHILKGNLSFHFKDAVTADYYQEKASVNKGKNSVVTLMNDYLTKRLKQDGFSSAKFRLVDEITYYATDQDYADQQARQEINDAKAQAVTIVPGTTGTTTTAPEERLRNRTSSPSKRNSLKRGKSTTTTLW